jgi:hypothetical protein
MRQLFFFLAALSWNAAFSQWSTNGTTLYYNGGSVGIGTSNPGTSALYIAVPNTDGGHTNGPTISISNTSTFNPTGNGYNAASLNCWAGNGAVLGQFVANYGVGTAAPYNSGSGLYINTRTDHPIIFETGLTASEKMRITYDGNVAIGTTNPQGYKLAVNGNAIFTKVIVKTYSTWPDYVFKKGYTLPDLADLERYIRDHGHLPGIATERVVQREGVDLGEQQTALLKKVEELTLYLINENKTLIDRNRQLTDQNGRLEAQQKEIDELKAMIRANNNH